MKLAVAFFSALAIATPVSAEDLWGVGHRPYGHWVIDADSVSPAADGRTRFTVYYVAYDSSEPPSFRRHDGRANCSTGRAYWWTSAGLGFARATGPNEIDNVKAFACASPADRQRHDGREFEHFEGQSFDEVVAMINSQPRRD